MIKVKFLKSILIVSLSTFISRLLGYVRDVIVAEKLGTGTLNDAFIAAFRLTNTFRNIFAEGALSSVFVPEFSTQLKQNGQIEGLKFASRIHSLLIIFLLLLCILVISLMPTIIWYTIPGFRSNPAMLQITVSLGRLTFPYLFCISMAAFYGGILNSFNKFFPFAIAPSILNIVIVFVLYFLDEFETSAHSLSVATLLGGILEMIWMIGFMLKNNIKLEFRWIESNSQTKKIFRNIVPIIFSSGITHLNSWISIIFLSFFPGSMSYLYYADRIVQLPLALIGTAMVTVLLPIFSNNAKELNIRNKIKNEAINFVLMFTIPSTFGIYFLSNEIIEVLFKRGQFDAVSVINTAVVLRILVIGLPAFILIKLFQTKFYAASNTRTPTYISLATVSLNIISTTIFIGYLGIGYLGVALANVLAGWANLLILSISAYKILKFKMQDYIFSEIIKYILSSLVMVSTIYIYHYFTFYHKINIYFSLIIKLLIGLVSYFHTCYILRVKLVRNLLYFNV